jgi:hypothetical protein
MHVVLFLQRLYKAACERYKMEVDNIKTQCSKHLACEDWDNPHKKREFSS